MWVLILPGFPETRQTVHCSAEQMQQWEWECGKSKVVLVDVEINYFTSRHSAHTLSLSFHFFSIPVWTIVTSTLLHTRVLYKHFRISFGIKTLTDDLLISFLVCCEILVSTRRHTRWKARRLKCYFYSGNLRWAVLD